MTPKTCECTGQCGDAHDDGRCGVPDGEVIYRAKSGPDWASSIRADIAGWFTKFRTRGVRVALVTVHLDSTPEDNGGTPIALCQRCHRRACADPEARRHARDKRTGQGSLFGDAS